MTYLTFWCEFTTWLACYISNGLRTRWGSFQHKAEGWIGWLPVFYFKPHPRYSHILSSAQRGDLRGNSPQSGDTTYPIWKPAREPGKQHWDILWVCPVVRWGVCADAVGFCVFRRFDQLAVEIYHFSCFFCYNGGDWTVGAFVS